MISIDKPEESPKILRQKGKDEIDALCREYLQNKPDYESGEKKFEFKSDVYGSKTVKDALIKAQHGKCFLCESKITHISFGDVEHFRPKGGSRQNIGDAMKVPGFIGWHMFGKIYFSLASFATSVSKEIFFRSKTQPKELFLTKAI